jgi:hypothetical protein
LSSQASESTARTEVYEGGAARSLEDSVTEGEAGTT